MKITIPLMMVDRVRKGKRMIRIHDMTRKMFLLSKYELLIGTRSTILYVNYGRLYLRISLTHSMIQVYRKVFRTWFKT